MIPEGMTEAEVMAIIHNISNRLASKFHFSYHSTQDIRQDIFILAVDGLTRYKPGRPLENFLWTHVRNRLMNFKRKHLMRIDKPCADCPLKAILNKDCKSCSAYEDVAECKYYSVWQKRNQAKQNLMLPISWLCVDDETEDKMKHFDSPDIAIETAELVAIIDKNLPSAMRKLWLLTKKGTKIPNGKMKELQAAIKVILDEYGIDPEEAW